MPDTLTPSYEPGRPLQLAGLKKTYTFAERHKIVDHWREFAASGGVPGGVGRAAYGVVMDPGGAADFAYMTAVEIAGDGAVPDGFDSVAIAPARFAVFHHAGNVATIADTLAAIHGDFMPSVHGQCLDDVWMLERYGERFDPATGEGGFDLLVPLKT